MRSKERQRYLQKQVSLFIAETTDEGCFIESGVKQGSCSVIMAQCLQRKGYLFDTWKNLPHFGKFDAFNQKRRTRLRKRIRKGKDTYDECVNNLKKNNVYELCKMIRGDICKTVPKFIKKHPNLSVSLVHSDSDIYAPTKVTFEEFWPFLIDGGMILVHDYKTKQWPGIEKSVDEFFQGKKVLSCSFDNHITHSFLAMRDNKQRFKSGFDSFVKDLRDKFYGQ